MLLFSKKVSNNEVFLKKYIGKNTVKWVESERKKYEFRQHTIAFLGCEVEKDNIRPPKARIDVHKDETVANKKELVWYIRVFGFHYPVL